MNDKVNTLYNIGIYIQINLSVLSSSSSLATRVLAHFVLPFIAHNEIPKKS